MSVGPGRLVLLGHPLGHSLSPRMQNAALRAAGIDLRYEPLDIPRRALEDTITALRRGRAAGNVTIPYKEAVRELCDRLTREAADTGAVNTFWTAIDGALVGDNTDVAGFQAAAARLLGRIEPGHRVGMVGAGGAAAAVLSAMKGWGASRIAIYTRTMDRALRLVRRTGVAADVVPEVEAALADATIVVNATPVGMRDDALPLPVERLPPGSVVLDLVYRVGETPLVRAAKARGHRATDGLHMLVEQGALAFERWFAITPDREAMWQAMPARR